MRAFRGPQQGLRAGVVEAPHTVDPGPGRVHDHERPYRRDLGRQPIAHRHAAHPAVRLDEPRDLGVARNQGPRLGGAAHGRDHEAGVVGLRIVVQGSALQVLVSQSGLETQRGLTSQPAVRLHVVEGREQIVQPHPRAELPGGDPGSAVHGEQEWQGMHQMRRNAEQHAPLTARLEYEAKLALLEIADAAVDEP